MKQGDAPLNREVLPLGHETRPPARFTEATLVKALEKDGIGRPSTYAPTIKTIVDRGYCRVMVATPPASPPATAEPRIAPLKAPTPMARMDRPKVTP